jgi:L-amino acid N-acyltransferase YncA
MSHESPLIRAVAHSDAASIATIYNYYIEHTPITFEETPITVEEIVKRIEGLTEQQLPWLVIEAQGQVAGYAYASQFRPRSAYRFTVETTIYLAHQQQGKGLGQPLYLALLQALRERNLHMALGGIALPNPASVALHEACGFTRTGQLPEVGYKFNQWIDVGYWQIKL